MRRLGASVFQKENFKEDQTKRSSFPALDFLEPSKLPYNHQLRVAVAPPTIAFPAGQRAKTSGSPPPVQTVFIMTT